MIEQKQYTLTEEQKEMFMRMFILKWLNVMADIFGKYRHIKDKGEADAMTIGEFRQQLEGLWQAGGEPVEKLKGA